MGSHVMEVQAEFMVLLVVVEVAVRGNTVIMAVVAAVEEMKELAFMVRNCWFC